MVLNTPTEYNLQNVGQHYQEYVLTSLHIISTNNLRIIKTNNRFHAYPFSSLSLLRRIVQDHRWQQAYE